MKFFKFIVITAFLSVVAASSFGFGFRIEADTYNESAAGCIPGEYFGTDVDHEIRIYVNNDDRTLLSWSTPFKFSGTATLNSPLADLTTDGFAPVDPDFTNLWNMGTFWSSESWDGDLSTPDQYNFSGLTMNDWVPGGGEMLAFTFVANFAGGSMDEIQGTFCIDSGDFTDNTYDWLFSPPLPFNGPYCMDVKRRCPCCDVEFANCSGSDIAISWDNEVTYDFDATSSSGEDFSFSMVSGPGEIDPNTGVYHWDPTCEDIGSHDIVVQVSSDWSSNDCAFSVTVSNSAPTISGDCGKSVVMSTNSTKVINFTANDPDEGDVLTYSVYSDGDVTFSLIGGEITIYSFDTEGPQTITVTVTDCGGLTSSCQVDLTVMACCLTNDIVIETVHCQLQGHHSYVDVFKYYGNDLIHGFDFLIGYDASALTFVEAVGGMLFDMTGDYQWEYFTYRHGANGNCGNGCPTGMLRVVALANQNDGAHQALSMDIPNGTSLFTLDFLVSNDRSVECQYVPIYFFWTDCGDNTIAFQSLADAAAGISNIQTGVSNLLYHYNCDMYADPPGYYEEHNNSVGFPTAYGVQGDHDLQTGCFEPESPEKPIAVPYINFFNGGVDIVCADAIDDRGDINLNMIEYEIADAVVFTNYFIYGLNAFTVNIEGQIAATEINGDGIALSVADLVYLIRVIVGDALQLPKIKPSIIADVMHDGSTISVNSEIGAALLIFEGNAEITLGEGASGMELKSFYNGDVTNVLIYSFDKNQTANGDLIHSSNELLNIELVDYNGNAYSAKIIPDVFSLKQNYPNPFNPLTVIEFSLPVVSEYTLTIFNISGQKISEESGSSEAGKVVLDIDLSNEASGVYFYKIEAGQFSDTKKMILLK